jgi:AcrR family transcriptional regulator
MTETETSQRVPTAKRGRPVPAAPRQPSVPATAGRQRMPAAERRELVLEAAMADFAVGGLAGTSTEDVARRAGISQPYLFRLFPTKKALFIALIERCFQRVKDTFTDAAAGLTGEEALGAMADAYEQLLEDRTLLQLQMQCYAACHDPEVGDATRAGFKGLWELTERLTGLPFQTVVDFFAVGMLMNVAAAMDLPAVDERWTSWCPKDFEPTD